MQTTALIYLGYALIAGLSLLGLYLDKFPYSLNKLFWIFCLFFFSVAPAIQLAYGSFPFPWIAHLEQPATFLRANTLIIASMLLFGSVRFLMQRGGGFRISTGNTRLSSTPPALLFFLLLGAAAIQVWMSPDLLLRQPKEEWYVAGNQSLHLLLDKGAKGMMLAAILLLISAYKQQLISEKLLAAALIISIASNFPLAIPRYWLAALYLGILLALTHPYWLRKRRLFELALSVGLILLFPLLSLLRSPAKYKNPLVQTFCSQDFDAYASLRNTLIYTDTSGFTKGKQISTTLLFFVPRNKWPEKSIGSGALVNPAKPGSDFHNYASPLIAEGYLDFGVAGALCWVLIAAFLTAYYDRWFWRSNIPGFLRLFYPAYLGLFFFSLRGDLLSSWAYTVGICLSAAACYFFVRKFTRTESKPS